jgi:nucleoside-diphosphate-sugar epimerase
MPHRIFVIGASGYLGSAIAARLARAGHTVHGLTRDEARAAGLEAFGIQPVTGDLADPRAFLGTLKNCDVAVHAAFSSTDTAALDQKALDAVRAAARDGRVRRFVYTSGMWVHGDTGDKVVDEDTPLTPLAHSKWRAAHEEVALDLAQDEVAVTVLRPAVVYGESRGIIGGLFAEARDRRTATMPGDGSQYWGLVHRDDVAEAYALAIEHAEGGTRYLLNDGSAFTVRQITEAIARVTGATARPWPREEVLARLGTYGEALLASQRSTAARARRQLGWVPRHTSFVDEIDSLFKEWLASQGTPVA